MHAPISNSVINPKAKLYKRFTPTETVEVSSDTIEIENNYYCCHYRFAWVNGDEMQTTEERPIDGLMGHADSITVKFNGRWKAKAGSTDEPEHGDVVAIGDELWIIEDGIRRVRHKSLHNFAVVYLPLKRLL